MEEDISAVWKTWQVYCFGKKKCLEGFCRKGRESHSCREAEDRKGAITSIVNSGTRSLEAEIVKGTAVSTGGFRQDFNRFKCGGVIYFQFKIHL